MSNISLINRKDCTGCKACRDVCNFGAISIKKAGFGFEYPAVDNSKCTDCGRCLSCCPVHDAKIKEESPEHFYGFKAKEDKIRFNSSSGGIFPLMADEIIKCGGVVAGAELCADGRVRHVIVDSCKDIAKITKTKYVQSETEGIYNEIFGILKEGKSVLFIGTPCQTEALGKIAGNFSEKLILADLICYGVPSPQIWTGYIHYLEKRYGGKFESFSFRDKREHDSGHTAVLTTDKGEYPCSLYKDKYCKTYFKNINIRESCFNCRFTHTKRNSDITIGDFWGIENICPGFDDKMGTSLVIIHSEKGEDLFKKIRSLGEYFECKEEDVLQPRLKGPTSPHRHRNIYKFLYKSLPFDIWLKIAGR